MSSRTIRVILVLLFFSSGLASLVLETVWVRMMVLVFGSTTFALSTVLTAFMGGLALGSWVAGRRAERMSEPGRALLIYGVLELGIGLYALGLPWLVSQLHVVHGALWGSVHSSYYTFALLRFLLAGLLLLLPTVAMGATLPVLARFFCAGVGKEAVGERVGTLYAVNTTGAVFGVFLAGFVLLPRVGIWTTNLVACLADLALGVGALLLARRSRAVGERDSEPHAGGRTDPPSAGAATTNVTARFALISIAISGGVAMVYQVAWTRAMSLIIGSSTYAFSLILICFLVGLAGGAALYARRQARQPDQPANLSVIHLLIAATSFAGMLFMDHLPVVLVTMLRRIELAPALVFLLKFVITGTVILLPTFFMGMIFPAVVGICAGGRGGAARTTGDVYATNTVGAIVGSFAAGFILVPLVGLQQSLLMMVMAGLVLAALFGVLSSKRSSRAVLVGDSLFAAVLVVVLVRPWNLEVMTAGVFRVSRYETLLGAEQGGDKAVPRDGELERVARRMIPPAQVVDTLQEPTVGYAVVFHREGVTTTVSMARTVEESLSTEACWVRHSLLVNGKPDASLSVLRGRPPAGCKALLRPVRLEGPGIAISPSGDAETQILSGLLPVTLYPGRAPPRSMLVIGWGSGITVGAALQSPLERLTAVELEREVVEAARHFEPHNHTPQLDPRVRLVNEDGRNYLAVNRERHDIVVSEPSNPWIAGCGNLFTREFFQLVHSRLNAGGIYLQWLQAYEIAPHNVWSILGTLRHVFPSIFVFRPVQAGSDLLIVALKGGQRLDWGTVERRIQIPGVRRELGRIRIRQAADLMARLLAGPEGVRRMTAGVEHNTDDNARIEFATPKDLINYHRYSASEITRRLAGTLKDPRQVLTGLPASSTTDLCQGLVNAGYHTAAVRLRNGGSGLRRCQELAAQLLEPTLPVPPSRLRALGVTPAPPHDLLKVLLKRRPAPFALLGHLYAHSERPFPALVYLLAARQRGAMDPIHRRVLGQVYLERGHNRLAQRMFREAARDARRPVE